MYIKIRQVRYHRNGVSGEPFFAISFDASPDHDNPGHPVRPFTAVLFEDPLECCAVLSVDTTVGECWRGDVFEPQLRAAVDAAKESGEAFKPN